LFLTLPTRWLTGQHVISSDGYGPNMPFSRVASAGSSPSHAGQAAGFRMRLWISAHSSLGVVVMIAKLRTHSPAGERQFSHRRQGHQTSVGERDRIGLFTSRGFLPLIETIHRHQTATPLECFAKGRLGVDSLSHRVDIRETNFDVLRPIRHQPPTQNVEAALAGSSVISDVVAPE
jgi:hypothetical protein